MEYCVSPHTSFQGDPVLKQRFNVLITMLGDVDGDFDVDIFDVVGITSCYGKRLGDSAYNANADLGGNGLTSIFDVVICTGHYGEEWL